MEDYFSRLNTALTRGKAVCRIGVIHPIESYWLRFGPEEHTGEERKQREANFQKPARVAALYGHLDFDFICESLLPAQCARGSAPLKGRADGIRRRFGARLHYAALARPWSDWKPSPQRAGGWCLRGMLPDHVDAKPSRRVLNLAAGAIKRAVQPDGHCKRAGTGARRGGHFIARPACAPRSSFIKCGRTAMGRWFFLCHGSNPANADVP